MKNATLTKLGKESLKFAFLKTCTMFNPNQAFLLVQKLKSAPPRALHQEKKIFTICPKLLTNAELYMALYWPPRLKKEKKKDTIQFGNPICNPQGQCSSIYWPCLLPRPLRRQCVQIHYRVLQQLKGFLQAPS